QRWPRAGIVGQAHPPREQQANCSTLSARIDIVGAFGLRISRYQRRRRREMTMKSVRLGLIVCFLASPLASAYADDASYCEALSTSYRKLIGAAQADAIAADAMAKCKAGDTAAGIP